MAPWALLRPGVLVRTGHTVLTWGITLVLFLHDTDTLSVPGPTRCPRSDDRLEPLSPLILGPARPFPGIDSQDSEDQLDEGLASRPALWPLAAQVQAPQPQAREHRIGEQPVPHVLILDSHPALRQWEEQGELLVPLTFLLLVLGSLLLYLAVSLMDPGYVNVLPQPQEEAKEEQTAMVPQAIPLRRCRYCMVLQPLRARHCRECRRCVRRYDHHCPWMENCVGERNHPVFVAYLALQLVVLLWGLYLAWSGLRFFRPWGLWLRSSGLLFATFLLLSLFSLVASLLLASHLYLVASNTTTWEFISSHRIAYLRQRPGNPFDRGLTRNLAHFFCGWPSGSWETLWAEDEEGSSQDV
uniref:Palmitoyltransferase n=1 Tax=Tursiops truncatus TaxID=9739 RepID=A0A6J3RKT3_TURTR|nr:probable palmitoyltransferase ZDHHC12 isoform X1 [Tursiops truncatus]